MGTYHDPDEVLGAYEGLLSMVDKHAAILTTKGINSATIKSSLTSGRNDLSAKRSLRNDKKTELAVAQHNFETSGTTNYSALSDAIDMVAGALGKQTAEGQQCLNLRKKITGARAHSKTTVTPAPPAPEPSSQGGTA